jgi:hypothetical protein
MQALDAVQHGKIGKRIDMRIMFSNSWYCGDFFGAACE